MMTVGIFVAGGFELGLVHALHIVFAFERNDKPRADIIGGIVAAVAVGSVAATGFVVAPVDPVSAGGTIEAEVDNIPVAVAVPAY